MNLQYIQILRSEEEFWKLKSRIQWLQEGDKNTSFFHRSTINRHRKNRIIGLKFDNNSWSFNQEAISDFILNHFVKAYITEHSFSYLHKDLFSIPHPALSSRDQTFLSAPCTINEITQFIFSFSTLKAPGPDGLHPLFFQNFWKATKDSVCFIILSIWDSAIIPHELNKTYIVLIPKKCNADKITQFRPINLCNTIYKVLRKVLANRIKSFLHNIISHTQAIFLSSRRTADNTIIVQEVLHYLRTTKTKRSHFILKMDMEKAFDRLEWSFIRVALTFFKFPPPPFHQIDYV